MKQTNLTSPRVLQVSHTTTLKNRLGTFQLTAYIVEETPNNTSTHLTICVGQPQDGMLLRINSACVTSETLGDERCDCSWQLWQALAQIQERGLGLVIYSPNDEARGVGLFNKINSFHIMETLGYSSAQAFTHLSLPTDNRNFVGVVTILQYLNIKRVKAISNNPRKLKALRDGGIEVEERVAITAGEELKWKEYLLSKKIDFEHMIDL